MADTILSFSKINEYLSCPSLYYKKNVTKEYDFEKDKNSAPLIRGNNIHSQIEQYILQVKAKTQPVELSDDAKPGKSIVDKLFAAYPIVEAELAIALDKDWKYIPINRWWQEQDGRKSYIRAKLDITAIDGSKAVCVDIKSGKYRPYEDGELTQLRLFALTVFALYPEVEECETVYAFVDEKKMTKETFYRNQFDALRAPFDKIHKQISEAQSFPATKNKNCKWCSVLECQFKGKW